MQSNESRASRALAKAFRDRKRGFQKEFSRKHGLSQPQVSRLTRGGEPSLEYALVFESELGIPAQWWFQAPVEEGPSRTGTEGA